MPDETEFDRLANADDRTIVGRAADGDVAAFEVLVRRYSPMMRAYARRILNSSADVDDVVQEAFLVAWQRLADLGDAGKVKSWLMRIISHKAVDRLRAQRPEVDLDAVPEPVALTETPVHAAEMRAEVRDLGTALQELPEVQRQCWVLRELAGYSYDEVARELDLPVSTVRGLLARARKYLVTRMEEWR